MKKIQVSNIVVLTIILMAALVLPACQPTPEKAAVTNKSNIDLEQSIKNTATPPPAEATEEASEERRWQYSKDYDSGNKLIVDAVLRNADVSSMPVLSVVPKKFESGEQVKKLADIFCTDANVYGQGDGLTKAQLEQTIMDVKQEIFNVENDLPPHPGAEEPIPEENKESYLQGLNQAVDYYEQQLPTAPDTFKEVSYELTQAEDGSMQANLISEKNGTLAYLSVVNWGPTEKGSVFIYDTEGFNDDACESSDIFVLPETLDQDEGYLKAKGIVETCVKDMGIDYMSLDSASRGEGGYCFYYTRRYNGLNETYVQYHTGTSAIDESAPMIYLWGPEYVAFAVQNNEVLSANWHNPAEIAGVDNPNAQAKPWEKIQEIFKTQMDYMMSAEPASGGDGEVTTVFPEKTEVHINRIELGLTKILMKDSGGDYKLVPTWNFMGYDTSEGRPVEEGLNMGAGCCFVSINAIDGTVIDRGLMY